MSALDEIILSKKYGQSYTPLESVLMVHKKRYPNDAATAAAELLALRERVVELESERRFIDGIVMGDGNHDKIMLTKDAMIFMQCMKLLGLDVSGCGPESIVDAITALKSQ